MARWTPLLFSLLFALSLAACNGEGTPVLPPTATSSPASTVTTASTGDATSPASTSTTLNIVQTKATVLDFGCSITYEGTKPNVKSRIRLAARGSATADVGAGIKVLFDINGTPDQPDTLTPGVWMTLGGGPSPDAGGAPLVRPEGALDTTAWAATDEFTIDGMAATFPVAVRVTEYNKDAPFFHELVSARYDCKAPPDDPIATPKVLVTPTPTPRLASTIDPARDVTGTWRGGINLAPATDQACQWSGPLVLTLQQTNGVVTGSADITLSKTKALQDGAQCDPVDAMRLNLNGTVSSSSIQFKAGEGGFAAFSGSFTSSLMSGTVAWTDPQGPGFKGCFQVSRSGAIADCGNPYLTPTPAPTVTSMPAPTATRTATPVAPTRTPTRTPTPTPQASTMTIDAASCVLLRTFTDQYGYSMGEWQITASGTASGAVGVSMEMPNWLGYKNYVANVNGWTYLGTRFAQRKEGNPVTATYSVQFTMQSNASSSPGVFEPLRGTVTGSNSVVASRNVTCPAG